MNPLTRILRRVFPVPRKPLTWRSAIPLIAFLVVIGGLIAGLYVSGHVDFVRPLMFLLMLVTPWIWWMHAAGYSGLPKVRGVVSLIVRLAVVTLLITVLAEPRAVRTSDVVSVVYALDVSDSFSQSKNAALRYFADTASNCPDKDQVGLVVFGRTAAVEYPPREVLPIERYLNTRVDQDATNLEQTLALSAAILPEEHRGRIVVMSDGSETVGQFSEVLGDLRSRGIEIDVVRVAEQPDSGGEVLLERLDLPRFVRPGETYEASVVLSSMQAGTGDLVLTENETELERRTIEFPAGKSRYRIPIDVAGTGYFEYEARIEVSSELDTRVENNIVKNYLYIEGEGKVLLVTNPEAESEQEWKFLEAALVQGERRVEVRSATDFPLDPLQLMPYDAVVFADVPADALIGIQQQALHDAVRNLGIGFAMIGGPNSYGPGGYNGSPIEDALPVSMEITQKKVLPKAGLVIILHTCEFPQGNTWAKRITKQAIKVLNSEDLVGCIGYGMNGNYWIFELTEAGSYDSLVPKINGANIGDMPDFISTMEMGHKALVDDALDISSRHMIIISDGDPALPPPSTMNKFTTDSVSVSTVTVFPHGQRDSDVMKTIAGTTGGRHYFPSDPNQLPSIFIKEAKTLRRSMIQEQTIQPILESPDPIMKEIVGVPELDGYVLTTPKPRASVVLRVPPAESEDADNSDVDPILAVWRYGLGVTAAFTSDMSPRWGNKWVEWDQFEPMVRQILTRVARVKREQFLRVYTYTNGNEGVLVVEDFHPEESLLDLRANIRGPNGFEVNPDIRQIAPRRYQVSVPLQGQGRYQVNVKSETEGRRESAYGGFIVSYSPEYLRYSTNPIALEELRSPEGNSLDPDEPAEEAAKKIFGDRQPKRSSNSIFDWLLMTLACLIPMDVAVRRVQIDLSFVKTMFVKQPKKETSATMGALLQRKDAVRSSLESAKSAQPRVSSPVSAATPVIRQPVAPRRPQQRPESPPSTSGQSPAPPPEPVADNTTSRLLALKRKRDSDQSGQ